MRRIVAHFRAAVQWEQLMTRCKYDWHAGEFRLQLGGSGCGSGRLTHTCYTLQACKLHTAYCKPHGTRGALRRQLLRLVPEVRPRNPSRKSWLALQLLAIHNGPREEELNKYMLACLHGTHRCNQPYEMPPAGDPNNKTQQRWMLSRCWLGLTQKHQPHSLGPNGAQNVACLRMSVTEYSFVIQPASRLIAIFVPALHTESPMGRVGVLGMSRAHFSACPIRSTTNQRLGGVVS